MNRTLSQGASDDPHDRACHRFRLCTDGLSPGERAAVGGLTGAALGVITADALRADRNWTTVAALGGAAAGVLVARNTATGQCAYSDGRGGYYRARC